MTQSPLNITESNIHLVTGALVDSSRGMRRRLHRCNVLLDLAWLIWSMASTMFTCCKHIWHDDPHWPIFLGTLAGKPEHCWRGMYYQIPPGLVQILATCEQGINIKRPIHRYSRTQQYQSTWSTAVVMQPADLKAAETKRIWILTIEYAYTKGVLCILRLLSPGDFILCCRAVFGPRLLVFQPSSPSGQHICSRRVFSPQEAKDSEYDAGLLNKLNIKCYGM